MLHVQVCFSVFPDAEDEAENTVVDVTQFEDFGEEDTGEAQIFQVVETMPTFKGNMNKWLKDNVKYPILAQENGISGRVFVAFVVEVDGSITDVKVARSVDPSLDKEAVRVVKAMPKWNPGKQRNKPVRVAFTVPINFTLTGLSRFWVKIFTVWAPAVSARNASSSKYSLIWS